MHPRCSHVYLHFVFQWLKKKLKMEIGIKSKRQQPDQIAVNSLYLYCIFSLCLEEYTEQFFCKFCNSPQQCWPDPVNSLLKYGFPKWNKIPPINQNFTEDIRRTSLTIMHLTQDIQRNRYLNLIFCPTLKPLLGGALRLNMIWTKITCPCLLTKRTFYLLTILENHKLKAFSVCSPFSKVCDIMDVFMLTLIHFTYYLDIIFCNK